MPYLPQISAVDILESKYKLDVSQLTNKNEYFCGMSCFRMISFPITHITVLIRSLIHEYYCNDELTLFYPTKGIGPNFDTYMEEVE